MTSPARTTSIDPGLDSPVTRSRSKKVDEGTLDLFGGAPAVTTHVVEVRAHTRVVAGPKPPSGAERKDAALEKMSERDAVQVALAYVRAELVTLFKSRQKLMPPAKWFVTAEDADRLFRNWPRYPAELIGKPNFWRGSLFKAKGWALSGHSVPAKREHMNGTTLPGWKWEGE